MRRGPFLCIRLSWPIGRPQACQKEAPTDAEGVKTRSGPKERDGKAILFNITIMTCTCQADDAFGSILAITHVTRSQRGQAIEIIGLISASCRRDRTPNGSRPSAGECPLGPFHRRFRAPVRGQERPSPEAFGATIGANIGSVWRGFGAGACCVQCRSNRTRLEKTSHQQRVCALNLVLWLDRTWEHQI